VEFFPLGATLYILTEGGKKIENIRNNPLVSLSVHGHFSGWASVRGLQISGTAEIGTQGSGIFTEGTEAYRKRRRLKSAVLPDFMHVIKVRPRKIEYIDATLEERGFSIRQELEYDK
jgi:hypothetical protein